MTEFAAEILLVEDNSVDLEIAQRALNEYNFGGRVQVARDGEQALDYLFCRNEFAAGPAELPRVVLLDLKLPLIDGLEVLRAIRADPRTRYLPVVVLTSSNEKRDLADSYALGANSYITKPVNFAHFKEAMRTIGTYWLTLNQPSLNA